MPVSLRSPTILACALAIAGIGASAPAHATWIFNRLQPAVQTSDHSSEVGISNDGRTVVFVSGAQEWIAGSSTSAEVYAYDLDTRFIELVSATQANVITSGVSPVVSRDGRYVAYLSYAGKYDNGTPEGGTLSGWQVVRKDRQTGLLELVTKTDTGVMLDAIEDEALSISGDGRYVAFASASPLLGATSNQVFRKDMQTGAVALVSVNTQTGNHATGINNVYMNSVSDDGRFVLFKSPNPLIPGVTTTGQIYLRDMVGNTTELVSRRDGANGEPSTVGVDYPALSPNGRFVLFKPYTGIGTFPNYSGVFLRDRVTQTVTSIPSPSALPAGSTCYGGDVSDVGIVFIQCGATGQAFLWAPGFDPQLMSYNGNGNLPNGSSGNSLGISASGLSMAFESGASDIDPSDTNGRVDVFLQFDSFEIFGIFRDGFED